MISLSGTDLGIELLRLWKGSWRRTRLTFVGRSMAPLTDRAGALVISHAGGGPRVGDILLTLQRGNLTAHRAVGSRDRDGRRFWITQGDSCPDPDPEAVPEAEILGRVSGLIEADGETPLIGPFWRVAGRWAAAQTRAVGRLLRSPGPATAADRPAGARRWLLAVHRLSLRPLFGLARTFERLRRLDERVQVHLFRPALWRIVALAAAPGTGNGLPPATWARGFAQARAHGLDLMLPGRLRDRIVIPAEALPADRGRREAALGLRRLRWEEKLQEILAELRAGSVPVLALKGLAQSLALYAGDASREMRDVDFLILPGHEEEARRRLAALGFRERQDPGDPDFPRHHHGPPVVHHASGMIIELHTEIVPARVLAAGLARRVWERAETVDFRGIPLLVPGREDRLLHLCLHLQLHRYAGGLRDILEIAAMVDRAQPPWDWGRLESAASEPEARPSLYIGLRLARLSGSGGIPEDYLRDLAGRLPYRFARELRIRFLARQLTGAPPTARDPFNTLWRWLCRRVAPL